MLLLRTSRHKALAAIVLIGALVFGGLSWTTKSAIELQRIQASTSRDETIREQRRSTLQLLEDLVGQPLDRAADVPIYLFRAYYKPELAWDQSTWNLGQDAILLPSPLRALPDVDWMILHFQTTESADGPIWNSPQLEKVRYGEQFERAMAPDLPGPAGLARLENARRWLSILRERYTPTELQALLEEALDDREKRRHEIHSGGAWRTAEVKDAASPAEELEEDVEQETDQVRRFTRRGRRLLDKQRGPEAAQCVPESVVLQNFYYAEEPESSSLDPTGCVEVERTRMTPVWIDLRPRGPETLAYVRLVSIQGVESCKLQGLLIDWPGLKQRMEAQIQPMLPGARLVPVKDGRPHEYMLHAIPVRLDLSDVVLPPIPGLSTGLIVGLSVAWVTTILALGAISYGMLRYVSDAERRLQFVAAVTHELRTPLTSFQLYTDLLAETPLEDRQRQRSYVDTLSAQARRLARLVENVLSYSRMSDRGAALQRRSVRPEDVLKTVLDSTREHCAHWKKRLVVENQCNDHIRLETDPEYVQQILDNLVENACKHSAGTDDPRVWLTARTLNDGAISFTVEDAGGGVPAGYRRQIFQPFRRGDPKHARQTAGLGLGLTLSRHWARCLGGQLQLRRGDRNGGHFNCFELTIPAR